MGKARAVNCYTKKREFVRSYPSVVAAERDMSLAEGCIIKAAKVGGTSGGYRWKYADEDDSSSSHTDSSGIHSPVKKGMSIQEFREKHDVMIIIRKGVRALKKGELLTTAEFVHDLKLPGGTGYRDKLMLDEFEVYRGQVNANDIRWGHPDDIAELKEDRLLK